LVEKEIDCGKVGISELNNKKLQKEFQMGEVVHFEGIQESF